MAASHKQPRCPVKGHHVLHSTQVRREVHRQAGQRLSAERFLRELKVHALSNLPIHRLELGGAQMLLIL